ncbi:hypothetical protein GWK48_07760 [Metallosphaera tengchongensis]|uniref:Uncharacterized protein n=1 Tax=Metallosphaera tengchongensis TaxID=1532350 RepID=A0A6N0NWC1_9CREN|nr:hypothetical protein GWK48_07760 [Metallosphaera tengchongensis]
MVLSSPVKVILVSERGGIDPLLIERFRRIFQKYDEIYIRRAFKVEDVRPTIEAMGGEFVLVDPYHHRKKYTEIVSGIRRAQGRKFIFSFMDREREGSVFGLHTAHSLIKLEGTGSGFRAKILKSVSVENIEIPFGTWEIFGRSEEGLVRWL